MSSRAALAPHDNRIGGEKEREWSVSSPAHSWTMKQVQRKGESKSGMEERQRRKLFIILDS